jgi:hypothetical protein
VEYYQLLPDLIRLDVLQLLLHHLQNHLQFLSHYLRNYKVDKFHLHPHLSMLLMKKLN